MNPPAFKEITVSRARVVAASMALILAAGCYSYPQPVQISPPKLLTRGSLAELSFPNPNVPQSVEIDVMIETNGMPLMSTFKAVGPAAAANQEVLYKYIEASTFRPGLQNGQPVTANYHTRMQFKVPGT
ncbi:MAG: hypothetical protein ACJ79J_11065 [Gemmatimonadaceae bacterium]